MSSKNKKNAKKGLRLDKQSGATIVLAFTFVCFMLTMFMATNNMDISYAAPNDAPPTRLTFNGTKLTNAGGDSANKMWTYMGSELPLGFDFKATDGQNTYDMYCIEGQVGVSGTTDTTYVNPTPLSSLYAPGLAFILNNSYPNNTSSSYTSVCSTDDKCKKYITQYAIWYYLDKMNVKDSQGNTQLSASSFTKIGELNVNNGYAKAVVSLVNAAISYNSNQQAKPELNVNTKDVTYSVTSDGKYLESSEITVSSNNTDKFKSYTVSLPKNNCDAEIISIDGNATTTFSKGTSFKVRIPMEKLSGLNNIDLGLNLVATFDTDVVYEYTPSSGAGNEQKPIISTYTSTTTNANLTLNISLVEFTKTDITNGKPVSGAELVVTDQSGAEVARWTTDGNPHYISLAPGSYTLTEITSPDGYELNKESIVFTVLDDGTITKVEMKNTPTTNVPDTAENIPLYLYIIGAMILVIGVGVIYTSTKTRKNK